MAYNSEAASDAGKLDSMNPHDVHLLKVAWGCLLDNKIDMDKFVRFGPYKDKSFASMSWTLAKQRIDAVFNNWDKPAAETVKVGDEKRTHDGIDDGAVGAKPKAQAPRKRLKVSPASPKTPLPVARQLSGDDALDSEDLSDDERRIREASASKPSAATPEVDDGQHATDITNDTTPVVKPKFKRKKRDPLPRKKRAPKQASQQDPQQAPQPVLTQVHHSEAVTNVHLAETERIRREFTQMMAENGVDTNTGIDAAPATSGEDRVGAGSAVAN